MHISLQKHAEYFKVIEKGIFISFERIRKTAN